jgi:hypothetical protein
MFVVKIVNSIDTLFFRQSSAKYAIIIYYFLLVRRQVSQENLHARVGHANSTLLVA